jgi:phosphoglycerate dehydrogenase-like enzyme
MRMLGCNRTVRNVPQLVEPLVYPLEVLAAMAAGCDYLLLIATLALETDGLVSETVLAAMWPGSVVVKAERAVRPAVSLEQVAPPHAELAWRTRRPSMRP